MEDLQADFKFTKILLCRINVKFSTEFGNTNNLTFLKFHIFDVPSTIAETRGILVSSLVEQTEIDFIRTSLTW